MSKKVVIAGSLSFHKEIKNWANWWTDQGFTVINYPNPSSEGGKFPKDYPDINKKFFQDLSLADIVFVVNEDKNGVSGYIGAHVFAEIVFVVANNLVHDKNTKIILAQKPSQEVQSYEEIEQWLELGWVELLAKSENRLKLPND